MQDTKYTPHTFVGHVVNAVSLVDSFTALKVQLGESTTARTFDANEEKVIQSLFVAFKRVQPAQKVDATLEKLPTLSKTSRIMRLWYNCILLKHVRTPKLVTHTSLFSRFITCMHAMPHVVDEECTKAFEDGADHSTKQVLDSSSHGFGDVQGGQATPENGVGTEPKTRGETDTCTGIPPWGTADEMQQSVKEGGDMHVITEADTSQGDNETSEITAYVEEHHAIHQSSPAEIEEVEPPHSRIQGRLTPYYKPNNKALGFTQIDRSDHATNIINTHVPSTHPMMYVVLFQGGWCILDDVQAAYLEKDCLLSVGLEVDIMKVEVLPATGATLALLLTLLKGMDEPSVGQFAIAALRVRAALHSGGLGHEATGLSTIDNHLGFDEYDEITPHVVAGPPLSDYDASNPLPSHYVHTVYRFLFSKVEFLYGAKAITVADLYDGLIDYNTKSYRVFLNAGLTPHMFRAIMRYLCINTQGSGHLQHLVWRTRELPSTTAARDASLPFGVDDHWSMMGHVQVFTNGRRKYPQLRRHPNTHKFAKCSAWNVSSVGEDDDDV